MNQNKADTPSEQTPSQPQTRLPDQRSTNHPVFPHPYYMLRRKKYLRTYDRFASRLRAQLAQLGDAAFVDEVVAETRTGFNTIIPQLPYIGGRRNAFTIIIVVNGAIIALYRAMRHHGKSAVDTIRVLQGAFDSLFGLLPRFVWRGIGRLAFTRPFLSLLRKQAQLSQNRRYPHNFVYEILPGNDDYDFVMEFSECAVNKLYDAQAVPELKAFCNFADVTYARYMRLGMDVSDTIGLGCATCSFKVKRGADTPIPPNLIEVLAP